MKKLISLASIAVAVVSFSGGANAKMSQGERLWYQCRSCHTLKSGDRHMVGPNIHGIINASAGTREGFGYSAALAESDIVWDLETLDRWIEKPNDVLRGHRMVYVGMKDAEKRAILIQYIIENAGSDDQDMASDALPE